MVFFKRRHKWMEEIGQRKAFTMDYSETEILQPVSKHKMAPSSLDVDMHCSVLVFPCTNLYAENFVTFLFYESKSS